MSLKLKQFISDLKEAIATIPGTVRLYHTIKRPFLCSKVKRTKLSRGHAVRVSKDSVRQRYLESPLASQPDSFILIRILGNDLPPRHAKGQTYNNLMFILENEPELERCSKHFILNRILDLETEQQLIAILKQKGASFTRIPFSQSEYRKCLWDFSGIPHKYFPSSPDFELLTEAEQGRVMMRLYRHKNNYVMNNNGARNRALNYGREHAKWVLPWDGNCFITPQAWNEITNAVKSNPELPYFIVPMARITDNELVLQPDFKPAAKEEPQIIFRSDAQLQFNESYYYGRRPKVELLCRLSVPGDWDSWLVEPWDFPSPEHSNQAGNFGYAGWVARLNSGRQDLESPENSGKVDRGLARVKGVISILDRLDISEYAPSSKPLPIPSPQIESVLHAEADRALERGPFSVVDKTTLPPSGSPHDYWHPAPYYWPNPLTFSGRPYVSRDGKRVPGTILYAPQSDQYDRSRLQRMFDDTTTTVLAWYYFKDEKYAQHAVKLVKTWFINSETAMTPHLRYAQVRLGHNNDQGSCSGIIEMKDVYHLLPAITLLKNTDQLKEKDYADIKVWFRQYQNWLMTSQQGKMERVMPNNHGVYFDLQLAAISAFLGDMNTLHEIFRNAHCRLLRHFSPSGEQPHELKRTTTAHYCCFNMQGWIHLAQLAEIYGINLWQIEDSDGRGLRNGINWLIQYIGSDWPFLQIDEFNAERFFPIYHACKEIFCLSEEKVPEPEDIAPLFHPHDGIRPFWQMPILTGIAESKHHQQSKMQC